jgi:hypothetical protein
MRRTTAWIVASAMVACTHGRRAPAPLADRVDPIESIAHAQSPAQSGASTGESLGAVDVVPRCANPPEIASVTTPMRLSDFVDALAARIDALDPAPIEAELAPIAARHGLDAASPQLLRDFTRLRTLFEATRDGGFWRLRWAITNEQPSSKLIWEQWAKGSPTKLEGPSATAECDEISALTSFLARKLEVDRVGLFYPTWNHTIVAWEPLPPSKKKDVVSPRILLPTTQIFLECDDAIDVTSFSATAQKNVYAYTPKDLSGDHLLSAETASFLLAQIDRYARASRDVLALIRLHRARRLDSSVGACAAFRAKLAASLETELACADEDALTRYWMDELHQPSIEPRAILRALDEAKPRL